MAPLPFRKRHLVRVIGHRAPVFVSLLAQLSPQDRFVASVSDASPAGVVGFSSDAADAILVPDADFFNSDGYLLVRQLARSASIPWGLRSPAIIWRGATTGATGERGVLAISDNDMSPSNVRLIQRTRMCLLAKEMEAVDAAFVEVVQSANAPADRERLSGSGIFAERRQLPEWTARQFAIDIDGNSNAWSNLFQRLLLGCCVIKIESPRGFRQWYYGDLVPGRHFVAVKPDMSDFRDKVEWCRGHPRECEEIAAAGQALAMAMTVEREMERAVARLRALLRPGQARLGPAQTAAVS